jgi:hypothetical protein
MQPNKGLDDAKSIYLWQVANQKVKQLEGIIKQMDERVSYDIEVLLKLIEQP